MVENWQDQHRQLNLHHFTAAGTVAVEQRGLLEFHFLSTSLTLCVHRQRILAIEKSYKHYVNNNLSGYDDRHQKSHMMCR